jgi:hypothetical protein
MKQIKTIVRHARKEDEVATARVSIRNHCVECMGWNVAEVERCTSPDCWLYPHRLGKTPSTIAGRSKQNRGNANALHQTPEPSPLVMPEFQEVIDS